MYLQGLASAMGLPADRFGVGGVTVVPGLDRRGERLVSHYRVGTHSVVWIDPDLTGALPDPWANFTTPRAPLAPDAVTNGRSDRAKAQQRGQRRGPALLRETVGQRDGLARKERRDQPVAGRGYPRLDPGRDLSVPQGWQDRS